MTAATTKTSRTVPAASAPAPRARAAPAAATHELDPARDDDLRARRSAAARRRRRLRRRAESCCPLGGCGSLAAHLVRRQSMRRAGAATILFVGDVVGGLGRRHAARAAARAARALRADFVVVNGENTAGGLGITPKIADELFAAGVDVDHARQPHLPPPRDLPLPRQRQARSCGRPTSCAASPATAPAWSSATACASASSTSAATCYLRAGRAAFPEIDAALRRARRQGRPRPRRHARRGDEREGRDGLAPRRPRDRGGRHPHARPTADARVLPGGTAYITDVGMTGPRGGRDRRQARAGDRVAASRTCRALRDLRRGPVARWASLIRCSAAAARRRDRAGAATRGRPATEPASRRRCDARRATTAQRRR